MFARAYRTGFMTPAEVDAPAGMLFEERLGATSRDWRWFPIVVIVTFLAASPIIAGVAALAWIMNVVRFRKVRVLVEPDYLWVGRRSVRLCALELSTLGQAGNTWPWRALNRRYLGANPFWTDDSVGLRGLDNGKRYWVAVGTNRRDELVGALNRAVPPARARAEAAATWSPTVTRLPPAGWYADPWEPAKQRRWWDGRQWTGWTAPGVGGTPPPGTGSEQQP
jgi:hypothetical protein